MKFRRQGWKRSLKASGGAEQNLAKSGARRLGLSKEGPKKLEKRNNKLTKFPKEARRNGENPEDGACRVHKLIVG